MKILSIDITEWRHFRSITIRPDPEASLICLVGANGAGKSQILELIAACAHRVGLSSGVASSRGDPFGEAAEFSVKFLFPDKAFPDLHASLMARRPSEDVVSNWDSTVTVVKGSGPQVSLLARDKRANVKSNLGTIIQHVLTSGTEINYLALDADRSYPKMQVQAHELATIYDRDWETSGKQSSFQITRTLYEEWFKYLIAKEGLENNRYISSIRIAREAGASDPIYVDQFLDYRNSLRQILPHLLFTGVDSQKRDVKFNSTGVDLGFHQLSGGEREIAFLVGQIDRFKLTKGLLLVDEPELHLNPELLRGWISFLKGTVKVGQIWMATHSLDVVETAGAENTFVLEREETTRTVKSVVSLPVRPLIDALAKSVGSPAFAFDKFAFVYVEGEESLQERERFARLSAAKKDVRFVEAGNSASVLRQVESVRRLESEAERRVRLGGIIDRDFRSEAVLAPYKAKGIFVLGVHEVENLYLHPPTLREVIKVLGGDTNVVDTELLSEFDRRAGLWISESVRIGPKFKNFPPPETAMRAYVAGLGWADIALKPENYIGQTAQLHGGLTQDEATLFETYLKSKIATFQRIREDEFWQRCEGKETFRALVPKLGFANELSAEKMICRLWTEKPELVPKELADLRSYVGNL